MKISWRYSERCRIGSFAITEVAMTSETMGLIESFSGQGIIHQILSCRVVDEHQKDYQASQKR